MLHHNPTADETVVELSDETRTLVAVDAWNTGSSAAFIQLFSAPASAVTLGETAPDWVVPIPAQGGRDPVYATSRAAGSWPRAAMEFPGGLSYAITSTAGGSGAPASAVVLSIAYV